MTQLRLFTSNRLEILAESLSQVLRTPLASPLDQEIIVVQSKGMERWVCMELARHHGICANCRFPFPNAFIYEVFRKAIPHLRERSPFDPKIMAWKIMKLLPSCITMPAFKSLRTYFGDTGGYLKRFQLSERIADTFDQYLLFRPEMILKWEENKENHWQAALWRKLAKGHEKEHRAALAKVFFEKIEKISMNEIKGLPERVSVFGISVLPRFHMQVFAALSRFTETNLFLMNPCKEYWGDIVSDWEMKKTVGKANSEATGMVEDLYLETGNSLLASMGRTGRDFFDLVNEFTCEEITSFEEPGEDTILTCLQSDILNLRDREQRPEKKKLIGKDDTSVQIHSCHSPMREIEVLHDRLLDMFEKDPSLLPKDIVVMTPDVDTYAPYIQAVFDVPADDTTRFPFTIADRSARRESQLIDTFLAILDLCGGRFPSPQVLAILESVAVRQKFGLSETDLEIVRRWVLDTRIKWGIDTENRSQLGLPPFSENTWKAGLERLLLGYAMPRKDDKMFYGILPYDRIEGSEACALGKFVEFSHQLFVHVTSLNRPRTLNAWSKTLTEVVERFFLSNQETESEMRVIRRTIRELCNMFASDGSGFDEDIDISVIKWHLGHQLEQEGFGFGFATGGITFCAMLPMRSIPFKVICMVGMNGDAYPRESKRLGFDLIAENPKPGDRSRRDDDRYLFLEGLLSARKTLYISYVGQSIQDNSPIPPSVLLSELMDYIEQGFAISGKNIIDHIVTMHRLQGFSPEYFKKKNGKLFSYSEVNRDAAQRIVTARKDPEPFISMELSDPEEAFKTIDLDELCKFFANPTKFLFNKRLGIYLEERALIPEDRECFDVMGLEKYLLGAELAKRRLSGQNLNDYLPVAKASGQLPHGTAGKCIYDNLSKEVTRFVERMEPYISGARLEPMEVDLSISDFRLTGRLNTVYPERLVQYRYGKMRPRDRVRMWIHHLALNSLKTDHYPRTSMLAGLSPEDQKAEWVACQYLPVKNSEEILGELLCNYWLGLTRPIHFFSESSWVYAQILMKKENSHEEALRRAFVKWVGSSYDRGECKDDYYQLCFRDSDPLDVEFENISMEIFEPLLEYEQQIAK